LFSKFNEEEGVSNIMEMRREKATILMGCIAMAVKLPQWYEINYWS